MSAVSLCAGGKIRPGLHAESTMRGYFALAVNILSVQKGVKYPDVLTECVKASRLNRWSFRLVNSSQAAGVGGGGDGVRWRKLGLDVAGEVRRGAIHLWRRLLEPENVFKVPRTPHPASRLLAAWRRSRLCSMGSRRLAALRGISRFVAAALES